MICHVSLCEGPPLLAGQLGVQQGGLQSVALLKGDLPPQLPAEYLLLQLPQTRFTHLASNTVQHTLLPNIYK